MPSSRKIVQYKTMVLYTGFFLCIRRWSYAQEKLVLMHVKDNSLPRWLVDLGSIADVFFLHNAPWCAVPYYWISLNLLVYHKNTGPRLVQSMIHNKLYYIYRQYTGNDVPYKKQDYELSGNSGYITHHLSSNELTKFSICMSHDVYYKCYIEKLFNVHKYITVKPALMITCI